MPGESVLVSTNRLEDPVRRLVTEACTHARVRPVFWTGSGVEGGGALPTPSLLVAALPVGQRHLPEDVVALATQTFHALPLLLLCGEPLVRNSVSLHGGRITLLGHPLTREKISARIRTALVGGAPDAASGSGESGRGEREGGMRIREFRGREWWAGALAREGTQGLFVTTNPQPEVFPSVAKLGRHGFAGLLPLNLADPLPAVSLFQAAEALVSAQPAQRGLDAVAEIVGNQAAGVWFSPAEQQWSFYCPQPLVEFYLYSSIRLPSLWKMGPTAASGAGDPHAWRHVRGAGGDLVLLSTIASGAPSPLADDLAGGTLWRMADGGGPALLDHLEARLRESEAASATLIVEVR